MSTVDSHYQPCQWEWEHKRTYSTSKGSFTIHRKWHFDFSKDTRTGYVYQDNDIRLVTLKCFLLIIARPVHTVLKTLYHTAIPISLYFEFQRCKTGKERAIVFLQNIADIVRTPLYGLAMTIVCIAGAIFGLCGSERVLDCRNAAGMLELAMNWDILYSKFPRAACFQPLNYDLTQWAKQKHADTVYRSEKSEDIAIANIARAFTFKGTKYYMRMRECFNNDLEVLQEVHDATTNPRERKRIVKVIKGVKGTSNLLSNACVC